MESYWLNWRRNPGRLECIWSRPNNNACNPNPFLKIEAFFDILREVGNQYPVISAIKSTETRILCPNAALEKIQPRFLFLNLKDLLAVIMTAF
jgi:hypothetical protein